MGEHDRARVLLLSCRRLRTTLANSSLVEFEDVVRQIDRADLFCPTIYRDHRRFELSRNAQRIVRLGSGGRLGRRAVVPYPVELVPQREYDLLVATFDNPWDLSLVNLIEGVRHRFGAVVAYVTEVWPGALEDWKFRLEDFGLFDHIFVASASTVELFSAVSGVACSWFPPAVDCERFAPRDRRFRRVIDVVNLGRRMPGTHGALRELARDEGWFYLYDDVREGHFDDPIAHRDWLADVLLRSRYNIANYARCDRPDLTRGRREIGSRFVEGAASGTVMLGAPPEPEQLARQMPWEDAVVPLPVDAPGVVDVLRSLEADPDRVEGIRRRNVAGALRHHDWAHRWLSLLAAAGLAPQPDTIARLERLAAEADGWDRDERTQSRST